MLIYKILLFFLIVAFIIISVMYIVSYHTRSPNVMKRYILAFFDERPKAIKRDDFPKILHLMYFPWDWKTGKLKPDQFDFNRQCYEVLKEKNKDWEIKLWTYDETKKFAEEFYPQYNEIHQLIKHPVQLVDFYRLLVVYHFGGIYWQYDSKQKTSLDFFLPPDNKKDRVFIEGIINKYRQKQIGEKHIIRKGKPEEEMRIATQCFCSFPQTKFIKSAIDKSWDNLHKYELLEAYDILYIGGNAMFSEAYDQYENKDEIKLSYNTKSFINFSSKSSWQLDKY